MTTSEYDRIRAFVERTDAELVRAVDDVDLALLAWAMALSPWERLQASSDALGFLSGFRRAASEER